MNYAQDLIDSEVYQNINTLVDDYFLAHNATEFQENLKNTIDWSEVVITIINEADTEAMDALLEMLDIKDLIDIDTTDFIARDVLLHFCYDYGIDLSEYDREIFEWYSISEWLHGILTEIGYPTVEFAGMYIMGRITLGQALKMDYFWTEVQTLVESRKA